jgi:hypothetical protein
LYTFLPISDNSVKGCDDSFLLYNNHRFTQLNVQKRPLTVQHVKSDETIVGAPNAGPLILSVQFQQWALNGLAFTHIACGTTNRALGGSGSSSTTDVSTITSSDIGSLDLVLCGRTTYFPGNRAAKSAYLMMGVVTGRYRNGSMLAGTIRFT